MGRRRSRRRYERERARRPKRPSRSLGARIFMAVGGLAMVAGGVGILAAASAASQPRLFRVAGILILVGLGLVVAAVVGL